MTSAQYSYDRAFPGDIPLPLARLYTRAHHAKGDRECHDHAFHLLEATLKLAASALISRYRSRGAHSEKVDAALRHLALPSLGQWRDMFRETVRFLAQGPEGDAWAKKILEGLGDSPGKNELDEIFASLARAASYAGRIRTRVSLLDILDLIPTYRNAMSDAHGSIKADPRVYREMTPVLLDLTHTLLEAGAILGGGSLMYAEDVNVGMDGERRVVWMDLTGPTALRRKVLEGEATSEHILPGRLYLEVSPREHLALHPLLHYRPEALLDQVFYLNRARRGRSGVQYLCYDTGEFYLPGRDELGDFLMRELEELLSWILSQRVDSKERERLAHQSRSDTGVEEELPAEEEAEPTGTVFGDFELLGELGRGGMAVVYKARQRSLDRIVALKVLPPALKDDSVALSRFRQEVRALSRCDDQNVVKILSAGEVDGTYYYAMEFIDGGDLASIGQALERYQSRGVSWLSEEHFDRAASSTSPLDESVGSEGLPEAEPLGPSKVPRLGEGRNIAFRLAAVIRDAARGTQHIHHHGIIHRDLKPQNIMVTRDSHRPVVMDLGLAKVTDVSRSLTLEKGGILGTLRYMPPEQLQRNLLEVDARADVYALGAVLYELTCLRPMLDGNTEERLTAQILFEDPPPPQRVNPRVPTDLATIITKATQKDPKERYASAAGLADDLDRFVNGEAIVARPPTLGYLLRVFVKKHRIAVAAGALAILLFAGLLVAWMVSVREAWRETRWSLYAAHMQVAHQAWKEGDLGRAQTLLDEHRPTGGEDLRGFAWRYLWKLCRGDETETLGAHEAPVQSVAFSPDGQRVAASSRVGGALWDVGTKEKLVSLPVAGRRVAFSPDGRWFASCGSGDGITLWEVGPDGRPEQGTRLIPHARVRWFDFSADSQRLVSAGPTSIKLWDVASASERDALKWQEHEIARVAFSPDGETVAFCGGAIMVRLWNLKTGDTVTVGEHTAYVQHLAFAPDGVRLASASNDSTIRIWDTSKSQLLRGHSTRVRSVVFSPDGRTLASGSEDNTIRLWDPETGEQLRLLRGHRDAVRAVAFSPDGRRLASASDDGTVKIWDASPSRDTDVLRGHRSFVWNVAISPGGELLAAVDNEDQTVKLWNVPSRREVTTLTGHEGRTWGVDFSPDGSRLATGSSDATIKLWDPRSGRELDTLEGHDAAVWFLTFSPDGEFIASASRDKTVKLWDVRARKDVKTFEGHEDTVYSVAFSPDGTTLASGSQDQTVRLWDVTSGQQLAQWGPEGSRPAWWNAVAFSPDGRTLAAAGGSGPLIRLWDVATRAKVAVLRGHLASIRDLRFSPDGKTLASASFDSTVKLWNMIVLKEVATLRGHEGPVGSVVFSADGNLLVSGSADATVRLWEAASLEETELPPETE